MSDQSKPASVAEIVERACIGAPYMKKAVTCAVEEAYKMGQDKADSEYYGVSGQKIIEQLREQLRKLQAEEIKKWIPIERDLTAKEKCEKQIELYSPCGCGSGKKFKFCCHQKNQRFTITEIASVIPWARAYHMGDCNVLVAKEPIKIRGIEREMWHLSIAHPHRYPTWEEITFSRYRFLPDEAQMAMLLPPKRDYVNIHANCFHLYEIDEIFEKQPNNENLDSNHTA